MSAHESGFAEVDGGGRLHFDVAGEGPPLLLLHAGIADLRMWDDVWEPLCARHRVVRYDLRGFGRSSAADVPYAHHRDAVRLLDALGIERAALLGISFGSGVAIDTALAFPERVAALVLVAGGPFGSPWPADLAAQAEAADAAFLAGEVDRANELELRMWVDGPRRAPHEVDPEVRERMRVMNREVWLRAAEPWREPEQLEPPALGRLAEIGVPALAIVGDHDVDHARAGTERLAREIPGARLAVIDGPAHMVPMESPAEFARLVLDFLAGAQRPAT